MFAGARKLRSSGADRSIKLSEEGTERCGAEFACLQGRGSCGAAERTVVSSYRKRERSAVARSSYVCRGAEAAEQRSGPCGFVGAAKRQRKKGNPAKSAAFRAGKKPKRQRNQRKTSESAAFPS